MKLAMLYNFAPKYRTAIFSLIDKTYDCDWFFGRNKTDIKGMDPTLLKSVKMTENTTIPHTPLYYQKGFAKSILSNGYEAIIMLGEPFNLTSWSIMLKAKLKRKKPKIYIWTHGWYGREGFAKKWLKRIYFGMSDHVFTYGEYAKEIAEKQGFDISKISAIHNSLDYSKQKLIRDKKRPSTVFSDHFGNELPNIIFIGRLTYVKKLNLLIRVLKLLKSKGSMVNLTFIGDGEARSDLETVAINNGIEQNVWFYGACYDDEKNAELIYNADICVSPGNVGLTAIHSMMFGTPVLSHNDFKMQMPEFEAIKPGLTGDFFKYNDEVDIAYKIKNWIDVHKNNREAVREACYREIDSQWTPEFQINVLKSVIK